MAIDLNCDCDCPFPQKTMAQLRAAVFTALGFLNPLTDIPNRTLSSLRDEIVDRLGLAGALQISTGTASAIKTRILNAIGQAANPSVGPMASVLLDKINHAQQTIYARLEMDGITQGTAPPAYITMDSTVTTYDQDLVFTHALADTKAYLGQADAKVYFDQFERRMSDQAQRLPPNILNQIDRALQSAQRSVYTRYEVGNTGAYTLAAFSADGDMSSVDPQAILLLAIATLKGKSGQGDAKVALQEYEQYMQDLAKRSPPNALGLITGLLSQVQETLFYQYDVFRMERWFTWTLSATTRFYGISDNDEIGPTITSATQVTGFGSLPVGNYSYRVTAVYPSGESAPSAAFPFTVTGSGTSHSIQMYWTSIPGALHYKLYGRTDGAWGLIYTTPTNLAQYGDPGVISPGAAVPAGDACLKTLNPRAIHWAGVCSPTDECWRPLRKGVPPVAYTANQTGVPTHYDVRQCIEVWPTPIDGWKLRIKGKFDLDAFAADSDKTTIDWQAIQLRTIAEAKMFYNQKDAPFCMANAERYVGNLIAGSHGTARYIPGQTEPVNWPRPLVNPPL